MSKPYAFEFFDSINDGWLKRIFKTWHAPKTLKTIQLNLIIWHVLGISIQNQTNFKKLPQNMTCLEFSAQNQTRFEKLVSECEAARKIILIKVFFFSQSSSEWSFPRQRQSAKCVVFTVWDDPKNLFFLKRIFQWILIFHKKFSFNIWNIVNFPIQFLTDSNLTCSRKFDSKTDTFECFWLKICFVVKNWLNMILSKSLVSNYLFSQICLPGACFSRERKNASFDSLAVWNYQKKTFFERKHSLKTWLSDTFVNFQFETWQNLKKWLKKWHAYICWSKICRFWKNWFRVWSFSKIRIQKLFFFQNFFSQNNAFQESMETPTLLLLG